MGNADSAEGVSAGRVVGPTRVLVFRNRDAQVPPGLSAEEASDLHELIPVIGCSVTGWSRHGFSFTAWSVNAGNSGSDLDGSMQHSFRLFDGQEGGTLDWWHVDALSHADRIAPVRGVIFVVDVSVLDGCSYAENHNAYTPDNRFRSGCQLQKAFRKPALQGLPFLIIVTGTDDAEDLSKLAEAHELVVHGSDGSVSGMQARLDADLLKLHSQQGGNAIQITLRTETASEEVSVSPDWAVHGAVRTALALPESRGVSIALGGQPIEAGSFQSNGIEQAATLSVLVHREISGIHEPTGTKWHMIGTSASTGEGAEGAVAWLRAELPHSLPAWTAPAGPGHVD